MSAPRDTLHQPPNPDDLRRIPPTTPDCARVRGWLRDFADGDLDARRVTELENHVHRCRVCSIELARAEHEVLRLRAAFAAMDEERVTLPADFAARVVERLVVDETSILSSRSPASLPTVAPAKGAPTLGGSARDTAGQRGRSLVLRPAAMLLGAFLLVLGFAFWVELIDGDGAALERQARLVVIDSDGTFFRDRLLAPGDGLGDRESCRVGRRGNARIEWNDSTDKEQPAATLQVHANGEVCLERGALSVHGRVGFETHRPVSIPMADGTRIDLGEGEYVISAEVGPRSGEDPRADMPLELQVEVQVKSGQQAAILRVGFDPTLVAAGYAGIYQGKSETAVVSIGGIGGGFGPISGDIRQPADTVGASSSLLIGYLRERTGAACNGSDVLAKWSSGQRTVFGYHRSQGEGMVQIDVNGSLDAPFAVTFALSPENRPDLGLLAPDAAHLLSHGPHHLLATPLVFDNSPLFTGQVRDEVGAPRPGVHVVPCLVDELFGTVFQLPQTRGITDHFGVFRCARLPVHLPPRQSLVALLFHNDLAPAVVPIPARASPQSQVQFPEVSVRRTRLVRLSNLPGDCDVLEELPGLPAGTAVRRRAVHPDANGVVPSIAVGWQPLWIRYASGSDVVVQQLTLDDSNGLPTYRPLVGSEMPRDRMFHSLESVPGTGTALEVVNSFRHQHLDVPATSGLLGQSVQIVDVAARPVAAQVFAVDATGPRGSAFVRFLGFSSAAGMMRLSIRDTGSDLVAIGPDGACATRVRVPGEAGSLLLELEPPGRAVLHESLRPTGNANALVALTFQRLDDVLEGLQTSVVRYTSAGAFWEVGDLTPGQYRVTVGTADFTVVVPPGGYGVIQPQ